MTWYVPTRSWHRRATLIARQLNPQLLKPAVTKGLCELMAPIQAAFTASKEWQEIALKAYPPPEEAKKKVVAKFGPNAQFAALLNTKCFDNGMIVMAFSGGSNLEGTKGDHLLLAPAYNLTPEQVGEIVRLTVKSVEEVIADIEY